MSECLSSSEVCHDSVSRKCLPNGYLFEQPKMIATTVFACIFVALLLLVVTEKHLNKLSESMSMGRISLVKAMSLRTYG